MAAFETGIIFRIGPGRRPGGEEGEKTILLRTTPERPSGLVPQGAGFLTGDGKPRGSSANAGVLSAG
ncbi:hypothetical protein B5M44_26265, partial [Shinella sumterensis]